MSTVTPIPSGPLLLDTCAWIDAFVQPEILAPNIRKHLESRPPLRLSAISPWEVAVLVEKGRIKLGISTTDWFRAAIEDAKIELIPISPEIALESTLLPGEFHKDPADRLIVASARKFNIPILTSDGKIHDYSHVRAIQSR